MRCENCGIEFDLEIKMVPKGKANWRDEKPSEKQLNFLRANKIDGTTMTKGEASDEIDRIMKER